MLAQGCKSASLRPRADRARQIGDPIERHEGGVLRYVRSAANLPRAFSDRASVSRAFTLLINSSPVRAEVLADEPEVRVARSFV